MECSFCAAYMMSTQAVTRSLAPLLPQGEEPVYALPFCPPHLKAPRLVSVIELAAVSMVTLPLW